MKIKMIKSPDRWVLCPICGNKTRTKIRPDTILENFPLFCPKCKQETLISAKDLSVAPLMGIQGSDRLKCCRSRPLWGKDSRKFHIYVL